MLHEVPFLITSAQGLRVSVDTGPSSASRQVCEQTSAGLGAFKKPSNGTGKNSEKIAVFEQLVEHVSTTAERELQSRESFEFMQNVGARYVVPQCKYPASVGIL